MSYLGLEETVIWLVKLPLPYYLTATGCLIGIRFGLVLCKYYPMVRRVFSALNDWSVKTDNRMERTTVRVESKDSPFRGNSVRKYSSFSYGRPKWEDRVDEFERINSTPLPMGPKSVPPITEMPSIRRVVAKERINAAYKTTLLRLRFNLEQIQDWFLVKEGRPLYKVLKGIAIYAGARPSASLFRFFTSFVGTCAHLMRTQGAKGLTIYLKASGIAVQQVLGGHHLHDVGSLGVRFARTKAGLPRFIPVVYRQRIRQGDPTAIRLVLTLISVYRILEFPGKLKLSTIVNMSTATDRIIRSLIAEIPRFIKLFIGNFNFLLSLRRRLPKLGNNSISAMFKGGPGVIGALGEWNTHPMVMLRALFALRRDHKLWDAFETLMLETGNTAVQRLVDLLLPLRFITGVYTGKCYRKVWPLTRIKPLAYLGKLGLKAEAAGKIRVFAMVDAWTQWVLWPIHSVIFSILKGHRMDGTFDQTAPLAYVKPRSGLWSLDLSAATDRLPIRLQMALCGAIFGRAIAGAWSYLLVGRAYRLHSDEYPNGFRDLKYGAGQPMGALSSWAFLAITHHFVVQAAAWRAGFPRGSLYTNYAVLGDDLVMGDKRVALEYLRIMQELGVGVNTSKSLLSRQGTALEFAKRTVFNGVDVSPVAWKEFYASTRNIGAWISMNKKWNVPFARALLALGAGWKVRSWLNKPLGKLSARIRLLILASNIPTSIDAVAPFFELGQAKVPRYRVDTIRIIRSFVDREVSRLFGQVHSLAPLSQGGETSNPWALKLARAFGVELGLDLSPTFWETRRDWHVMSYFVDELDPATCFNHAEAWEGHARIEPTGEVEDVNVGTSQGALRAIAVGLRTLIQAIRVQQTVNWVVDLNRLATECWELMKLTEGSNPINDATFAGIYIRYLELQREIAAFNRNVLATSRPNPLEVKGLLDPSQVRLWKRWSSILQGTQKLADPVIETTASVVDEVVIPKAKPAQPEFTEFQRKFWALPIWNNGSNRSVAIRKWIWDRFIYRPKSGR